MQDGGAGRACRADLGEQFEPTGGNIGQPAVANGASLLLQEVFGDAGVHVRSAVGVAELPLGSPVEVELVVEA